MAGSGQEGPGAPSTLGTGARRGIRSSEINSSLNIIGKWSVCQNYKIGV